MLCNADPAFPLDFVGIFVLKSIGISLGIFCDAFTFVLMNLYRVATSSTRTEIVFGTLNNPFYSNEGGMKMPFKLALRDRLSLIVSWMRCGLLKIAATFLNERLCGEKMGQIYI